MGNHKNVGAGILFFLAFVFFVSVILLAPVWGRGSPNEKKMVQGVGQSRAAIQPEPVIAGGPFFDPLDPAILYVSTSIGYYRSDNAGGSWKKLLSPDGRLMTIDIHPTQAGRVFGITTEADPPYRHRLYSSNDRGDTWNLVCDDSPWTLEMDARIPGVVFGIAQYALMVSQDQGRSWQPFYMPPMVCGHEGYAQPNSLTQDPLDPAVMYLTHTNMCGDRPRKSGMSLNITRDGGRNWTRASLRSGGYDDDDFYLRCDPWSPPVLYLVSNEWIQRSTDGGMNWTVMLKPGEGLAQVGLHGLAVDPWSPYSLFLGTENGLYHSPDRGLSWNLIGFAGKIVYNIVFDPQNRYLIYACTYEGLFRSFDRGVTWDSSPPSIDVHNPLSNQTVSGIVPVEVDLQDDKEGMRLEYFIGSTKVREFANLSSGILAFDWDTTALFSGNTSIGFKAYDSDGLQAGIWENVKIKNMVVTLKGKAIIDHAWILKRPFIELQIKYEKYANVTASRFVINRMRYCMCDHSDDEKVVQELTESDFRNGSCRVVDLDVKKGCKCSYLYHVLVYDDKGNAICRSNYFSLLFQ